MQFLREEITKVPVSVPIYEHTLAMKLGEVFHLESNKATAATCVAVKRILDGKLVLGFRFFQKGLYYRTELTPFGELGINKQRLIAPYLLLANLIQKRELRYEVLLALAYRYYPQKVVFKLARTASAAVAAEEVK